MSNRYYKIKELARLYGLCTDTLRYYEEQGLLSPRRGENNYRLFGIQDIGRLNVIRSLRELDMPIEWIREYIESRTVSSTLELMEKEKALIQKQVEGLLEKQHDVERRKTALLEDSFIEDGYFSLKILPSRPCFRLSEDVILEKDIDFLLKKLEKQYEDNIHVIGIKGFGAIMDQRHIDQGVYNHFQSVFFISDWENYNSVIPQGTYASIYYRGAYERVEQMLQTLMVCARNEGYELCGTPMELYHIDMNDTRNQEEYLTEIQVQVANYL